MTVTSKVRLYDLAKELKLDSKRLIEEVRREGVDVSVPSNLIPKELADKIRNKYFPKKEAVAPRSVRVVKKLRPAIAQEQPKAHSDQLLEEKSSITTVPARETNLSDVSPEEKRETLIRGTEESSPIKNLLPFTVTDESLDFEDNQAKSETSESQAISLDDLLHSQSFLGKLQQKDLTAFMLANQLSKSINSPVNSTLLLASLLHLARNGDSRDSGRFFLETLQKQQQHSSKDSKPGVVELLDLEGTYGLNEIPEAHLSVKATSPVTDELKQVLLAASELARVTDSSQIHTRHIIGAILQPSIRPQPFAQMQLEKLGFNLPSLRGQLTNFAEGRYNESAGIWSWMMSSAFPQVAAKGSTETTTAIGASNREIDFTSVVSEGDFKGNLGLQPRQPQPFIYGGYGSRLDKVRLYDLAKELKLDSKRLIEEVRREGVDVSVPSNSIPKELADKIRNKYFPKKEATAPRAVRVVKKAVRPAVLTEVPITQTEATNTTLAEAPPEEFIQASTAAASPVDSQALVSLPVGQEEKEVTQPPPALIPTQRIDPATTTIQQLIVQNFAQTVYRKPETYTTQTLDIHLTPGVASLEAEYALEKQKRQYQVILTLSEQSEGQPQIRYYEGPLSLDVFNEGAGVPSLENQYGRNLHGALFNNNPIDKSLTSKVDPSQFTLRTGYNWGLARRATNNEVLRFQLRINTQAPELHNYKWEYLLDSESKVPLACDLNTPFARVLHVSSTDDFQRLKISPDRPLRLLAAMASPSDLISPDGTAENDILKGLVPLNRAEIEALKEGLARLSRMIEPLISDNLLISPDDFVSLEMIRQRLIKARTSHHPFHVLHLLCHGLLRAEDGKSYLVLTNTSKEKKADLVPEEKFAEMLRQFLPELRLVVLASCFTALPTHEQPLQGIARRLVAEGIPAVIAMQDALEFNAAQHFSQRLYAELVSHGEIDRAVNAARRELYDRRRANARADLSETVGPRQWGIPVLFMRVPDGRLFDVDREAQRPSDAGFETQALPYEEFPSGDTKRLAEQMVRSVTGPLGIQLIQSVPSLSQTFREILESVRTAPTPVLPVEDYRVFGKLGEERLRWRLIQAAGEHRRHPARRAVLFLRSLARAEIARLVESLRLSSLSAKDFKERIWQGGHAIWDSIVALDIVDRGPETNWEVLIDGKTVTITSALWRKGQRHFEPETGEDLKVSFSHTGNLTWGDGSRQPPAEGVRPSTDDLEQLLYSKDDTFATFNLLTSDPVRCAVGLDEHTASLLLHAVYPDHYLPYHEELAKRAVEKLWSKSPPIYATGFKDYCALAHDLLIDDELGFEDLPDVSYFLQRVAHNVIQLTDRGDYPSDLRPKLQKVNLNQNLVDCDLVARPDVLGQAIAALNAGKHVIFIGPPGTGKTTLAESLCRHARDLDCNRGHTLVTAVADWTTFDTIGGYMPESGNRLIFRPGIFLDAIQADKWLVIDEINRADIDKAFGELFTVLSGQAVTLPYKDNGHTVRILPPGHSISEKTQDYAIHPSWRIIGTMNVFDKASLFAMSYAFMRRFAFIDVEVPDSRPYQRLIEHFLRSANLLNEGQNDIQELLYCLFNQADDNPLMRWRSLGPAIAKDVVRYLQQRSKADNELSHAYLAEALLLYVVPQFDGLERESIREIYGQLSGLFTQCDHEREALLKRIRGLFPFIAQAEWEESLK